MKRRKTQTQPPKDNGLSPISSLPIFAYCWSLQDGESPLARREPAATCPHCMTLGLPPTYTLLSGDPSMDLNHGKPLTAPSERTEDSPALCTLPLSRGILPSTQCEKPDQK